MAKTGKVQLLSSGKRLILPSGKAGVLINEDDCCPCEESGCNPNDNLTPSCRSIINPSNLIQKWSISISGLSGCISVKNGTYVTNSNSPTFGVWGYFISNNIHTCGGVRPSATEPNISVFLQETTLKRCAVFVECRIDFFGAGSEYYIITASECIATASDLSTTLTGLNDGTRNGLFSGATISWSPIY
jgi:hypothetical protein